MTTFDLEYDDDTDDPSEGMGALLTSDLCTNQNRYCIKQHPGPSGKKKSVGDEHEYTFRIPHTSC